MKKDREQFIQDILEIFQKKKNFKNFNETIEVDSIIALTLIAYFENEFKITLNIEDLDSFKTLNDIIKKAQL